MSGSGKDGYKGTREGGKKGGNEGRDKGKERNMERRRCIAALQGGYAPGFFIARLCRTSTPPTESSAKASQRGGRTFLRGAVPFPARQRDPAGSTSTPPRACPPAERETWCCSRSGRRCLPCGVARPAGSRRARSAGIDFELSSITGPFDNSALFILSYRFAPGAA